MPLDQIVIINNHEYKGKLHPPEYKRRPSEMRKDIRKSNNLEIKNSKSEEKLNERFINVEDSKEGMREY